MKNSFFKLLTCVVFLTLSYNSLKAQTYNDTTLAGFSTVKYGAAVNVNLLKNNAQYRALVAREYSSVTGENAMKFGTLHPGPNTYNFTDGDTLVNFAIAHNMRVHGHTLLWHQSLPTWVTNFIGDSTAWENLMRTHIQTVVTHYAGQVTSWDVVNEAFNDDGTYRNSVWYLNLGPNFIARAFGYAHAADPNALLFYNDYGHEYSTAKTAAIQNLANSLIAAGIPIDGLGLQMHMTKNTTNTNVARALDSMLATGLKVHIAELDISMNPENNQAFVYDDNVANLQYAKYKFITRYAKNITGNKLYGITQWNVTDADSWIPGNYSRPDFPLPFNNSYEKKYGYYGIKDALKNSFNFDAINGVSLAGTYTDLGATGTQITTGFTGNPMGTDNDNSSIQNIGFDFIYNGTKYTQFVLNTNGYIKMGTFAPSATGIFYPTANGNTGGVITSTDIDLIYPYNADLRSGTATAVYRVATTGAVGSRVCTIQFKNMSDKIAPAQYLNMEFQIKLYEGSNDVEFVYGNWLASANAATLKTAAIGLKGVSAFETVNIAKGSTVPWNTTLGVANNIFFKNGDYAAVGPQFSTRNTFLPDAGRTFRFSNLSVLPVSLLSFTALDKKETVQLQWTTTNEINNKNFEVQRSTNGTTFKTITVINAVDVSTNENNYGYTDVDVANEAVLYYRLKQNDVNGNSKFSPIIKVLRSSKGLQIAVVSPFDNAISLQIQAPKKEQVTLQLFNAQGQNFLNKQFEVVSGSSNITMPVTSLVSGIYFLKVSSSNNIQTIKIVKQ